MEAPPATITPHSEENHSDDLAEFEALFRAHYDALCSFAWSYLRSRPESEDVVQDAFVTFWSRRATWDRSQSRKAYLYTAVRNRALNVLKHRKIVRSTEPDLRLGAENMYRLPDEDLSEKDLIELIQEVIERLPDRRREIFVLHRQHGFSYREIADLLDISIRTVETQIARALDELRKRIIATSFSV